MATLPLKPEKRPLALETLRLSKGSRLLNVMKTSGYCANRADLRARGRRTMDREAVARSRLRPAGGPFGFTLIELMITIVVLAVLLGIAVPSFQETIRLNRTAAVNNDLIAGLQLARSEAIRRGQAVRFCSGANDGATDCDAGNLNNGWYVTTSLADPPASADAVRVWPAPRAGVEFETASIAVNFNPMGATGGGVTVNLRYAGCSGNRARQVTVTQMGNVTTGAIACTAW